VHFLDVSAKNMASITCLAAHIPPKFKINTMPQRLSLWLSETNNALDTGHILSINIIQQE
jgi:hypothetical protein